MIIRRKKEVVDLNSPAFAPHGSFELRHAREDSPDLWFVKMGVDLGEHGVLER